MLDRAFRNGFESRLPLEVSEPEPAKRRHGGTLRVVCLDALKRRTAVMGLGVRM
jgi:hypothetical protein